MSISRAIQTLETSTSVDWNEAFVFYEPDDVTPTSLAGFTVEIDLQQDDATFRLSTADGNAVIVTDPDATHGILNGVQAAWLKSQIEASNMSGIYQGLIRAQTTQGQTLGLLLFTVRFTIGVP